MSGVEDHIESLLRRMEEALNSGLRVPLTDRVVVEADELLSLIELVRQALPEEIREAGRVLREREEVLQQAREEAEGVVASTRETVARLTDETAIAREAQQKAEATIDKAREVAQEIRLRAVQYADEVLERLEAQVQRTMDTVRRHREELRR